MKNTNRNPYLIAVLLLYPMLVVLSKVASGEDPDGPQEITQGEMAVRPGAYANPGEAAEAQNPDGVFVVNYCDEPGSCDERDAAPVTAPGLGAFGADFETP